LLLSCCASESIVCIRFGGCADVKDAEDAEDVEDVEDVEFEDGTMPSTVYGVDVRARFIASVLGGREVDA